MVKIYKQPFAHGGDTIAIPDASQPDGKMSSAAGWTPDYQLPKTDPNYKPVGRQEMNGVFKEVTEALGQVQVQGTASWSADGAPYPVNAQVYHNGKQWLALRANSVAPVEGANWSEVVKSDATISQVEAEAGTSTTRRAFTAQRVRQAIVAWFNSISGALGRTILTRTTAAQVRGDIGLGTAATANLTTSNTDGTAGRVLKVGDGGWMGMGVPQVEPLGYPASVEDVTNQTKVIRSGETDNGVAPYSAGIHFSAGGSWGRLRVCHTAPEAWIQGGESNKGIGWTSQVVLYDNVLASMQPSMTGSIRLNGPVGNAVVMSDIVPELGLEVGDVIRINTGAYNKLHTVERITGNQALYVNWDHAGNRSDGSLKLPDFTGQATVTRIAKWYNAPLGLGQAWLDVTASRAADTTYTNTTGRAIMVNISTRQAGGNNDASISLTVGGVLVARSVTRYTENEKVSFVSAIVPAGATYRATDIVGNLYIWAELR